MRICNPAARYCDSGIRFISVVHKDTFFFSLKIFFDAILLYSLIQIRSGFIANFSEPRCTLPIIVNQEYLKRK
jgi:hypothetical protein